MRSIFLAFRPLAASVALAVTAGAATAAGVTVSITNEQPPEGVFLTPLLSIFHDGSYDTFSPGGMATLGLENMAEEGAPPAAIAEVAAANPAFVTGVLTSPGGFADAPVIDPGETTRLTFNLDPTTNRYFSYLSMVIPSNDLFIGNENPTAFEIFDSAGLFKSLGPIQIYTTDVWDAGTEVNNNLGAAFNAAGGTATDTTDPISQIGSIFYLTGQQTAAETILSLPEGSRLLATIEVTQVPVPAALPLLLMALGGLGVMRRRQV